MGRKLSIAGRVLFCAVFITQCCLLMKYVVKYEGKDDIYWLFVLLFVSPGIIAWLVIMRCKSRISWLGFVWLSYTCALTAMVGWIFGNIVIENKLDSAEAFGPNSLKAILCITPVLMLLLLQSTPDPDEYEEYRGILNELSFKLTLDLFDGIEMLQVLLGDCDENHHEIPKKLEIVIFAFVCAFFLLSSLELLQVKFERNGESKTHKTVFWVRSIFQGLVNLAFLIIRIVLWSVFSRNAPIFITKNGISLTLLVLEGLSRFDVI